MSKRQLANDKKGKHKKLIKPNPPSITNEFETPKSIDLKKIEELVKSSPIASKIISTGNGATNVKSKLGSKKAQHNEKKHKERKIQSTKPENEIELPAIKQPTTTQPITQPISLTQPQQNAKSESIPKKKSTNIKRELQKQKKEKTKQQRQELKKQRTELLNQDVFEHYGINLSDIQIDKQQFEQICKETLAKFDPEKKYTKKELISTLEHQIDLMNLGKDKSKNAVQLVVLRKIIKDLDSSLLENENVVLTNTRIYQDNLFKQDNTKMDAETFFKSIILNWGFNKEEHPEESLTILFGRKDELKMENKKPVMLKNGIVPEQVKANLVSYEFENELSSKYEIRLNTNDKNTKKAELFSF